jgi:DNA-binding HxlR family transcriptional regulator
LWASKGGFVLVTAEVVMRALGNNICAKVLYRLYKHGTTDIETIMKTVDYAPRYRSKFLSRYLLRLQGQDLVEITGDLCLPTPIGVLTVDILGKLKISEVSGKVQSIKALRQPKTNKQLQKILDVSRTFASILLRQLKEAEIVQTERIRYKIKEITTEAELEKLPTYYSEIIKALTKGNPERFKLTSEEIANITGLAEKSVQARLSELSRRGVIVKAGPSPLPDDFFVLYYKLTGKGERILKSLDKFERLTQFVKIIEHSSICENIAVSEEELWRYISDQVGFSVNTFEVRSVINILKRLMRLQGDTIDGYCKKGKIAHSRKSDWHTDRFASTLSEQG